jgi:hypothetical protein
MSRDHEMRFSLARYLGQAAVIVCTSCSGHTVDGGWNDEGATPDDASISTKCSVSDSSLVSVTDAMTFPGLLAGRWYRCGNANPSIGFAPAALELTSNLRWTILVADASSGAYVPSTAPGESGQFKIDEVLSGCCPTAQALSFDGNVHVDIAAFGSAPTRMSWAYDKDGPIEERIVGARYVQ